MWNAQCEMSSAVSCRSGRERTVAGAIAEKAGPSLSQEELWRNRKQRRMQGWEKESECTSEAGAEEGGNGTTTWWLTDNTIMSGNDERD